MQKHVLAVLLFAGFTVPALAGSCPTLMTEIDSLLADDDVVERLGDPQLERVRELLDRGRELHESGTHDESVDVLREALDILEEDAGSSGSGDYSY